MGHETPTAQPSYRVPELARGGAQCSGERLRRGPCKLTRSQAVGRYRALARSVTPTSCTPGPLHHRDMPDSGTRVSRLRTTLRLLRDGDALGYHRWRLYLTSVHRRPNAVPGRGTTAAMPAPRDEFREAEGQNPDRSWPAWDPLRVGEGLHRSIPTPPRTWLRGRDR